MQLTVTVVELLKSNTSISSHRFLGMFSVCPWASLPGYPMMSLGFSFTLISNIKNLACSQYSWKSRRFRSLQPWRNIVCFFFMSSWKQLHLHLFVLLMNMHQTPISNTSFAPRGQYSWLLDIFILIVVPQISL